MNNKLSLVDIAGLLSERTGKDKKATEQFLREFIQVVSAGLFTDKTVKIKGLGTFKIIPVEERESVHVNTGERFVIPAHYKYSFLPDKELRDTVNAPFAFFETTEVGNDVDFSDLEESEETEAATEDESVEEVLPGDALTGSDTVAVPVPAEKVTEAPLPDDELYPESPVHEDEPETIPSDTELQPEIVTVPLNNEENGETVSCPGDALPAEDRFAGEDNLPEPAKKKEVSKDKKEAFPESAPVVSLDANQPLPDAETENKENPAEILCSSEYGRIDPEDSKQDKRGRKSASFIKIAIPVVLLLIALVYVGSLFYEWHTESSGNAVTLAQMPATQPVNPEGYTDTDVSAITSENEDKSRQSSPTAMPADQNSSAGTENAEKKQSGVKNEPVAVPLPATPGNTPQAQKPVVATSGKIIGKVKIGPGDRLTLISLKYYGHKFFWVYLYEANKDVIKNPNNVPVGTTIKIPSPEVYGIDAHDKASVAKAAALQAEIIEGKD